MALAADQHGAISAKQLRRCGVSAKAQQTAVARGWLTVTAGDVLVVTGSPNCWHRRLQIGVLALDGCGWVSHEAAATLHNLDRCQPQPLEFTVPRHARNTTLPPPMKLHTTTSVGPVDVLPIQTFRCASATRTILDLAAVGIPEVRLAAAIDSAVRLGLSAPLVLAERLAGLRGAGRPGVRVLDKLLLDAGGETMLERRFLQLVRTHHLPRPTSQKRIYDQRRHVARVDFLYEQHNRLASTFTSPHGARSGGHA